MSRRRLVATLGLAASGFACAPAVNYLDPSGPLYRYSRGGTAAAPTAERPLRVRGGQRIRVYSLHLPLPLAISGGSRKEELRVVAADSISAEGPVVIAGDFNSHGKVGELAKAGFLWVTKDLGDTARLRLLGIPLGGLSYDHVLAKGLRPAPGPGAMGIVQDNRGASDHKPIWVVLEPDGSPAP